MSEVEQHADQGPPRWPGDTRGGWLPGNRAALGHGRPAEHGAWSSRQTGPIAELLAADLPSVAPWCASSAFERVRASWAHAEAQAVLLRRDIDERGMFDDEGEERPAVRTLDRVEGRLAKMRDQLGLTPTSLGNLLKQAASVATATGDEETLAALQAEGHKILAARLLPTEGDDEEHT